MVVKLLDLPQCPIVGLRVVLSHMVVKPTATVKNVQFSLRVVLSHMVVKHVQNQLDLSPCLRVVLSHMVVKQR